MNVQNSSPSEGEFLASARLVPDGAKGNTLFARTLRCGEEDTGESVVVPAGHKLVIRAGGLRISLEQIDACSEVGLGGYAPIANTVWTWYQFGIHDRRFFFLIFSLARRLDVAYEMWLAAIQGRNQAKENEAIPRRVGLISSLATAEMAVVALNRAIQMASSLVDDFCPNLELPLRATRILGILQEFRNAFEHIDERAKGHTGPRSGSNDEAWTIFDQPGFFSLGLLSYRGSTLDFEREVLAVILDCRTLIMAAMSGNPTVPVVAPKTSSESRSKGSNSDGNGPPSY